jgi:hypothetical protein
VAVIGFGFYPDTVIAVHCFQAGAGNVPGSADYMWEQASVVAGSGYGSGWINEHFIDDGQPINLPSPGVPPCGSPPPPVQAPPDAASPAPAPPQAPPASGGAAGRDFPVMNAAGGIYWRSSPNWSSAIAKPGNGVYPGSVVRVSCARSGGSVPGSANTMWVQAAWISGPGRGSGWINEHFINDGAPINQAAPGIPSCGSVLGAALSVGCYGDYCSRKDPKQTGCSADGQTLAAKDMSGARLELRWSPTCKTEWARWIQYPKGLKSDLPTSLAAVQDTGYSTRLDFDVNGVSANPSASQTSDGITTSWTPMIYSPVHLVRAVATVQCGASSIIGTAFDCATNGKVQTASR